MSGRDWQKERDRQDGYKCQAQDKISSAKLNYARAVDISRRSPRKKNWHGPSKLPRELEERMIQAHLAQKRARENYKRS